ncbi:hypothetical protein KKI23_01015 [Patescibacteria group bacterium]|nr:hypothetical protein [Patescibacteria group bacterium]
MNAEKWGEILDLVKEKFGIIEQGKEDLDPGEGEFLIFNGPLGKMKVVREVKPLVIDKKVISSRRVGSFTTEEFIYSDTEKTEKMKAYKWDEDDQAWVEMEMKPEAFTL